MMAQTPSKTPAAKKSAALTKQASPAKKVAAKPPVTKKAAPAKETIKKTASKAAKTSSKKSSAPVVASSLSSGTVVARKAPKKLTNGHGLISAEQRYQLICNAAYFRAERRGFIGGSAEQDWCEAEIEIDQSLYASPSPSKA